MSGVKRFALITYMPPADIERVIGGHDNILAYAYICHDMDGGELHYHVIIKTRSQCQPSTIVGYFKKVNDCTTLIEEVADKSKMIEYLTHKNYPDKYQYSEDDIHGNPAAFLDGDIINCSAEYIIDDMLCGMSTYDLIKKYGNAFAYHINQYNELIKMIKQEM